MVIFTGAEFELIAAIAPFRSLPASRLAGYHVELWIDNSMAIGSLTKGYSGVPDVARIVNFFEFTVAALGAASLYIDYVPSKSNPADDPSRLHEMDAEEARRAMAEYGEEVPMTIPTFTNEDGTWSSFESVAASVWGR